MVKSQLPLHKKTIAAEHGAMGGAGVILGERAVFGLWQLSGWDDFEDAVQPALDKLGLDQAGDYRHAQPIKNGHTWRIAPDRILVETRIDIAEFNRAELPVLDLSHARTVITLQGEPARDLLAQLVPVDMSADQFKPGSFIQSGIHHVGVLIQCLSEDKFEILVPSTWAEAVWGFVFDNALPFGIQVLETA